MTINQAAANNLLNLILAAVEWPGIAQNDAAPLASLYFALHLADPGPTGNQSSSEIAYPGYARSPIVRSGQGWKPAVGGGAFPVNNVTFIPSTGGSAVARFLSIGTAPTGAGEIIFSGPLNPPIVCGNNVTPTIENLTEVLLS